MPTSVLIAFPGPRDPFTTSAAAGGDVLGPVLAALALRPQGRLILLSRPGSPVPSSLVDEIRKRHASLAVETRETGLASRLPVAELARELGVILGDVLGAKAQATVEVSIASTPPSLAAACALAVAGAGPKVALVDPEGPGYPTLQGNGAAPVPSPSAAAPSLAEAMRLLGIVADHPVMRRLVRDAAAAAAHGSAVLVSGEAGSGKGLIARLVHELSSFRAGPYRVVDIGSLAEETVEEILLGKVEGRQSTPGLIERTAGGTLVVSGVDALSRRVQKKLYNVIALGDIEPVGSTKMIPCATRLVFTTTRDLRLETARGTFREDLLHRLLLAELPVPPLRERASDLPRLALETLVAINATLREDFQLSRDAITYLSRQDWPGNLREFRAAIERGAQVARGRVIEADDLLVNPAPNSSLRVADGELPQLFLGFSMEEFLSKIRRGLLYKALDQAGGNQSEASRLLGVSPQAVNKFLKVEQDSALNG